LWAGTETDQNLPGLRGASLAVQFLVILIVLAALFLFPELTLLLAALSGLIFLPWLSSLIALLAGLSGLSALLAFPFHIICHD
jgi:uncharacterized membrane protein YdjX (TVP38/TMEM64 family)